MSTLSNAFGGGGGSIPGYNTAKLNQIATDNANKQRQLIQQKFSGLQPINQQYQTSQTNLSNNILPQNEGQIAQFGNDLNAANTAEAAQRQQSSDAFKAQAFQNVPALQRQIRNSLGGNRLLNSGAAVSTLAQPTVQAAQNASNNAAQNEQQRLADVTSRANTLATTGFNSRQSALASKLGLDENTINQLASMGRSDLIDQFNSLAGVQQQEGADQLGIEQLGESQNIAQAQANQAKKSAILGSLGSIAGLGIGSFAGPLGAAVGSQIGGTVGTAAGGGVPQSFDPTLLFALAQKRQGVVNALSGGRSTNSSITSPTQLPS